MRILNAAKWFVELSLVAGVLAGCGGAAQFAPMAAAKLQAVLAASNPHPVAAQPNRAISWMARNQKGALLYIADAGVNDVLVYTWPRLRLIGNLSGFKVPQGECVDPAGNVWIANTLRSEMLEFAHGGLKPIGRLADPGQYPCGCSVDTKTGDLAVTNILTSRYGPGSLSIYNAARGQPKVFSDPAFEKIYFDGYDGDGNLFVDGANASGAFAIAKFDGKSFQALTIQGATINAPGAVEVTGSKINVEDQTGASGNSVMYETTLQGTTLKVDATAQFRNSVDCVQTFLNGRGKQERAICPDAGTPSINVYEYPGGGSPKKRVTTDLTDPEGAVVSRS